MITKPFLTKLFWSVVKKKNPIVSFLWRGKRSSFLYIYVFCVPLTTYRAFYFWHFWSQIWVGVAFPTQQASLQHQLDVVQFNSMWTLFTQRYSQFPRIRAQYHKLPPPPKYFHTLFTSSHCYLYTWMTRYTLELPIIFLGSIDLLEHLTNLRETLMFTSLLKDTIKDTDE